MGVHFHSSKGFLPLRRYSFLPRPSYEIGKMSVHPVILLIVSTYFLSADCRMIRGHHPTGETYQPLCSRMCDSTANFRENALYTYRCSCSQSCVVYKDCCYDSPFKQTMILSESDFACISVAEVGDFRAVTSCPPSWRVEDCRKNLGRLPPVTSRVTNVTYGNDFCAKCNEDGDDFITWNVELRCSGKNPTHFTDIRYYDGQFLGRNAQGRPWTSCKFYVLDKRFGILRDLELRRCGVPEKTSKCSYTWTDVSVKEKCRSYEDPVYVGNALFRNRHCAECNYQTLSDADCIPPYLKQKLADGRVDEDEIRSCMAVSPHECISHAGRGPTYSLSEIFYSPERATHERGCLPPDGRLCCKDQRYDPNTSRCRKVRRN